MITASMFTFKDCRGTHVTIMYSNHDIELLLGNGNSGFWRHAMTIQNKSNLIHATQIILNKSKHMLDDKDISLALGMKALQSHIKEENLK